MTFLIRDHNLIDAFARSAHQTSEIALRQTNRDDDVAVYALQSVLSSKGQQLPSDAAFDLKRGQSLNLFIGQFSLRSEWLKGYNRYAAFVAGNY